jgi:hypothetical protein
MKSHLGWLFAWTAFGSILTLSAMALQSAVTAMPT